MSDRYLAWISQLAVRDHYALQLFGYAVLMALPLCVKNKMPEWDRFNKIVFGVITGGTYVACLVVALSPFVVYLCGGR